jgi:hypothetical protein
VKATTEIKVGMARLQDRQWLLEMAMVLKERRLDIYVPMFEAFTLFLSHFPSLPIIHATLPIHSTTLFQCLYMYFKYSDLQTFVSLGERVQRASILHKVCMEKR